MARFHSIRARTKGEQPYDIMDQERGVICTSYDAAEAATIVELLNGAADSGLSMLPTDRVTIEHDFADLDTDAKNHFVHYEAGFARIVLATNRGAHEICISANRTSFCDDDSDRYLEVNREDARALWTLLSHPDVQAWMHADQPRVAGAS